MRPNSYKTIKQYNACQECRAPIMDYFELYHKENSKLMDRIEICARGHTVKILFYNEQIITWDIESD